jgi:hypothetical protein
MTSLPETWLDSLLPYLTPLLSLTSHSGPLLFTSTSTERAVRPFHLTRHCIGAELIVDGLAKARTAVWLGASATCLTLFVKAGNAFRVGLSSIRQA